MKFPDALNQFIHKTPEREEAYLSLILEEAAVGAAAWTILPGRKPHIGETTTERVESDAWDKRLEACDRAIAKLAQKEGRDDFEKVVLGLPAYYLTAEDDIEQAVRTHIKTITEELELTPIGFVPLHQSIVHRIKEEEGVPPSVILLEAGSGGTTMILYKVGAVVGRATIGMADLVADLERALKGFKELEVLPSRILLYGANEETLEAYKRDLLKHPWPTRANFLHYPKIEVLPPLAIARAVSLAGASELTNHMGESTELPQPVIPVKSAMTKETEEGEEQGEDQNVVEVSAETLGFKRDVDVLEKPEEAPPVEEIEEEGPVKRKELKETLARFVSGVRFPNVSPVRVPKGGVILLLVLLLLIGGSGWLSYWVLPKASITILQLPQIISESSAVTVNPTSTIVDSSNKIVPGRKQEKSVSGEKTIAVTGQKDMGDPAKGTATIYNKSLTARLFKKGTILKSGSLSFTLDNEVPVPAATITGTLLNETKTFGKASSTITAVTLGPQSNLPANKEFSVQDLSTEIAIARNDAALTGGTSKVVTVVSRADYDGLVDALTKDLIEKAKSELAGGVAGGERLIDETVKTSVTAKKFDAELGQESKELHGTISVSISGISYSEEDIASLFADLVAAKVPSGYTLRGDGMRVHARNVKIQKDGSIGVTVEYQGQALPVFDLPVIQTKLAGKTSSQVQEELRVTPGVGGIEMGKVSWSLWGNKFPANAHNISVSVAVLE